MQVGIILLASSPFLALGDGQISVDENHTNHRIYNVNITTGVDVVDKNYVDNLVNLNFIDSITKSGQNVSLVNDSASPGNSKYYGTDSMGGLGYHSDAITLNSGASFGITAPGAMSLGGTYTIGSTTDILYFAGLQLGVVSPGGQILSTLGLNNITGFEMIRHTDTAPLGDFEDFRSASNVSLWTIDITGTVVTGIWNATPIAPAYVPHSVTFVVDGSGIVLGSGTKNPIKIPYGGILTSWTMMCSPSGSVTADVLRAVDGAGLPVTSIVGSGTKPSISSSVENSSTSFTGWTSTTLNNKDNLAISLSGITAATYVELTLNFE